MKWLLVAALALAALCVIVFADDARICANSSNDPDVKITSITFEPNPPVKGSNFTVALEGSVVRQVNSGTLHLSVKYLGVPLYSHDFDMCKDFAAFVSCPLNPTDSFSRTVTETFPKAIPPGEYTGEIKATDSNGNEVFCIDFDVKPVSGAEELVNDEKLVQEINKSGLNWVAGHNKRFEGVSMKEARRLLGSKLHRNGKAKDVVLHAKAIPDTFDARQQWPKYVHPIRDQQQCGSCWAFGATEALSDRFAIASNGAVDVVLSPQDLVSCDNKDGNMGCQGGYLDKAWDYLATTGTVAEDCFPYSSGTGVAPECSAEKADCKRYKASNVVHPTDVESIQTLIMTSGPVEGGFVVYRSFFNYKSGVYKKHFFDTEEGGHAIKILGWGVENNEAYWLVANSWGTSWGIDGFFKILRGKNECNIESEIYAGTPVLN